MDGMGIYPVYPVPPPSAQISSLPQEKWAIFRRPEFQNFMTVTGILGPGGVDPTYVSTLTLPGVGPLFL